ncbi:hypothetical protein [Streptomyces sp. TLI_171]|uniref:hypothetical protein n=1 Tax=Streptomyces sp. TLI_171 TaxID=1938859 RepID=UPI000C36330F|nr:hypothetical protein [Streptomyces sp. TLI_171]RKE02924.1 hypothetical protein BX266_7527 [Streptomyces sp. TLI_171]
MTDMTDTRARVLTTILDTLDNVATATAAAATGLTTYRALNGRPSETRTALALAAAGVAACATDQITTQLRRPLRRRLGLLPTPYSPNPYAAAPLSTTGPEPTADQLAQDVAADAAHRAATAAIGLDRSQGSLTEAGNWTGSSDGTATCELPGGAHLLCMPSPADQHGYSTRSFLLVQDGQEPTPVHSIGDVVALLGLQNLDAEPLPAAASDAHWAAIGEDLGIDGLVPAATGPGGTDPGTRTPHVRADDSL